MTKSNDSQFNRIDKKENLIYVSESMLSLIPEEFLGIDLKVYLADDSDSMYLVDHRLSHAGEAIGYAKYDEHLQAFQFLHLQAVLNRVVWLDYDKIETFFHTVGNMLILQRNPIYCTICGSWHDLKPFEGKYICLECWQRLRLICLQDIYRN